MANSMSISTASFRRDRARRGGLATALALLLTACSSDQTSDWGDVASLMMQTIRFGRSGITLEQASAIPYASIGVRVDNSSEFLLVLATSAGNDQLWTSASHVVLLIHNGRIVRTAGLDHNLTESRTIDGERGAPSISAGAASRWEMDFADASLYSVVVRCTSVVRGPETVKNFSVDIPTIHVDEECRADQIDWSYTNSYWISPKTGLTWRTIQYVSPKLGPIEIEILRPPGAG